LGQKEKRATKGEGKEKKKRVFKFLKANNQMNSNTQTQCSSMYATLYPYD
jgi:hypothetical protein